MGSGMVHIPSYRRLFFVLIYYFLKVYIIDLIIKKIIQGIAGFANSFIIAFVDAEFDVTGKLFIVIFLNKILITNFFLVY